MKLLYIPGLLGALLSYSLAFSQPGSLDPSFGGGDGRVTTQFFADKHSQGFAIASQADGKIVVSGYTQVSGGGGHAIVARYLEDGTLDNSFNGSGKLIITVPDAYSYSYAVTVQPDGKIIVVVIGSELQEENLNVFRFLSDGSPDINFDGDGRAITAVGAKYMGATAVTLQNDGKILVGGYVGFDQDTFDSFFITRYLPNGSPDQSFDGDGVVITRVGNAYTYVNSLMIQPDGKILASGYASFNGYNAFTVARYLNNGILDHSFSGDGIAIAEFGDGEDEGTGAALQPDGKIIMGGYAHSEVTGAISFAAARFNPDGTLDNNFSGDGMTIIDVTPYANQPRNMLLQPDGKIVLGGYANISLSGGSDMALVRLNENGIPDFTFDGDGVAVFEDGPDLSGEVHDLTLQPDGKIVATGYLRNAGINAIAVARFITGLSVSTHDENQPVTNVALYPNPVTEQVIVKYELEKNDKIAVSLCDMQGRTLQQLMPSTERKVGEHVEQLKMDRSFVPGSYILKMEGRDWSKGMVIIKN